MPRLFMESEDTWVGRYVYAAFKPNKLGKVLEVLPKANPQIGFKRVRIRWEDGNETVQPINGVEDIMRLIEDHQRKLKRHLEHLDSVKKNE